MLPATVASAGSLQEHLVVKSSSKTGVFMAGMLVAVLLLVLLMVVGVLPVKTEQATPQTPSAADATGGLTPQQIYEQEGAGVVEVHASFAGAGSVSPTAPSSPSGRGLGTGFLVSSDGYIVTRDHVITNDGHVADAVVVVCKSQDESDADGTRVKATVVGGDVIQAIDGMGVTSAEDLAAVIGRHKSDTITLTVVRQRQTKLVQATLTERPRGA